MHERDQDVEDFIRSCPPSMTWSEIVTAIKERFGEARAWSRMRIFDFWNTVCGAGKGRPGKLDRDPEVLHFVEDRLGRMTHKDIAAACRQRFGERAPARSSIHRYHQKVRGVGPYRKSTRSR